MVAKLRVHEGTIRPSLVKEMERFQAPEQQRVSSYYLDIDPQHWGGPKAARIALKDAMKKHRERLDQLEVGHDMRQALLRDWEQVQELASEVIGERNTRSLACFVAPESGPGWALRLPWPVRDRAFFEDRFVLWPLQQILDQSDRYAICLADKDDARLFLFSMEQIDEVSDIFDEVPGRIRYPVRTRQLEYMRKHIEAFHDHFDTVSEAALRLLEREPFQHLIIGGLWETLPQFEGRLHRYLRDRIVARWDIDVMQTPTTQVRERAQQEEQRLLERQARDTWQAIQDSLPQRGATWPEQVFSALWYRRVQTLLKEPDVTRSGFRCTVCGRLLLDDGPCVECGGKTAEVRDVHEEAVLDAIEQDAHVRYWKDPALHKVDSLAAFRRF